MMAASLQFYFEEEVAFALCHNTIVEDSLLAAWHFAVVGTGCVLLLVARQPMRKRPFLLRRTVGNDGEVGLLDCLMLGKHLVEPGQSLACLGKQDNAADRTVQPVNNTEIDVTGLLILVLQVSLHQIRQRDIASLVSLNDVPCFLCYGYQMIIFV